jgi:AraC family transcriptional regulator
MSLEAVYQAVEYIDQHLQEEISIADAAEAAGYSLFHFCRVFNNALRLTPYDYLVRRRLSEAALALLKKSARITPIAFDSQFNSNEAFSRAFKRLFGMQPNQWKKQGWFDPRRLLPRLPQDYLLHIKNGLELQPKLVSLPEMPVHGVLATHPLGPSNSPAPWQETTPASRHSVLFYPSDAHQPVSYLVGDESKPAVRTLPAGLYASFRQQGPVTALPLTRAYIYHGWLPHSGLTLAGDFELEIFLDPSTPGGPAPFTPNLELMIPVKPL